MTLLQTKRWAFWDVAILKLFCLALGCIMGAHIASSVKAFLWIFILVVAPLGIRLFYAYFIKTAE
jgi:hypothetical protein